MSHHHTGEGWSDRNPIPTVQEYRQQQEELRAVTAHGNASHLASSEADEAPPASTSGLAPAISGSLDGLRQRKGTSTTGESTNDTSQTASGADAGAGAPSVPKKDDKVDNQPGGGQEEKERIKKAQAPKGKANEFEAKGERVVTDPTTGGDVGRFGMLLLITTKGCMKKIAGSERWRQCQTVTRARLRT